MRRVVYGTLLTLAVAAGFWYHFEIRRLDGPPRSRVEDAIDSRAPLGATLEFSGLKKLSGEPIDAGLFHRKVIVLEFWATWCEPCIHGMPKVERVFQALAGQSDVQFLPSTSV